jgi:steroid delta-isomerase
MTSSSDRTQDITHTVKRYLELVAKGRADDVAELYADDATVEDPVGSGIHIGRQAIRGFYEKTIENLDLSTELISLKVAGNEAAYLWKLTVRSGDGAVVVEPISVMVLNDDNEVTAMRAYWSPENVTPL